MLLKFTLNIVKLIFINDRKSLNDFYFWCYCLPSTFRSELKQTSINAIGANDETAVLAAIAVHTHLFNQKISRDSGISKPIILKTDSHKLHPYTISLHTNFTHINKLIFD